MGGESPPLDKNLLISSYPTTHQKGCHQGQNVIILAILERLEFEHFSCRPAMVADNTIQCSMAPHNPSPTTLSNSFRWPYNWWLIFTDVVFSFEKVSNGQNYSSSDPYHLIKNPPLSKIFHPPYLLTLSGTPCWLIAAWWRHNHISTLIFYTVSKKFLSSQISRPLLLLLFYFDEQEVTVQAYKFSPLTRCRRKLRKGVCRMETSVTFSTNSDCWRQP